MKSESRVVVLALIVGLLFGLIDSIINYIYFNEEGQTFLNEVFFEVSIFEIYLRGFVLFSILAWGLFMSRSITRRKKAEQQIKDVIDAAPDVIHVISPDMKILNRNSASKRMFPHIKEGDLCFKALKNRGTPCTHCSVIKVFKDGKKHEHESEVKLPDGERIIVHSTSAPIYGERDNIIAAVEILRDITKRKKAENMIIKYTGDLEAANHMKDLFTDIMRHDLLNHIGVIKNLSEMVLGDKRFTDSKDIHMIRGSAMKLEEMVDAASSYAKLESTDVIIWSDMDLNAIIKDAEDSLQGYFEEKHIQLEHLPKGRYVANTIPLVEAVFMNLLSNAVKYSPNNTKVTVNIEDTGKNLRVTVADQGDGVPDKYKEKIFGRLTRRMKEGVKGSGIGLAIVKRTAELHGGTTGVFDNPKGGSIFYFEIPKIQK